MKIQGLVIPTDWDEKGKVVNIAIACFDEDQFFVERNEHSKELFRRMGQEVVVSGDMRVENNRKIIRVSDIISMGSNHPADPP